MWKDVTDDFKDKLTIKNDGHQLNFDKLDKKYAVSYEGEYQKENNDLKFRTEVSGSTSEFYPEYYSTAVWDNGLILFQNSAEGDGQDGPIIDGNNFEFQEDTGNGGTNGHNNGNQTFEEDTDDDKPIYQNGGHTPIDWEEKLPDEHGQNNGNQTEEEDTMPPRPVPPTPESMENESNSGSKTTDETRMHKQMKELPNTGVETNKTPLFAGIFAVLGSLVLFRRNRQSK